MKADGSDQRRLTNNLYSDLNPTWSADGSEIVFASNATGATFAFPTLSAIMVVSREGGEPRRLTNHDVGWAPPVPYYNDTYPVSSPDGSKIAFLSDRAGGWREIFVLDVSTGQERQVTFNRTHHWNLIWDRKSEHILFDGRLDGPPNATGNPAWGIWSIRVSGSQFSWGEPLRAFKNDLEGQLEWDAVMSPSGDSVGIHIAYVDPADRTGIAGLYFAPVDYSTGSPRVLEGTATGRSTPDEYWADWSPDGSKIAFSSNRDGHPEVYVMSADGSGVIRLTYSRSRSPG